jgi:DNA invertase Pin-like site-specific DNA recombinase
VRFILYARASTKDKQHPEHQIAELRTEAARRGWTVAEEVIELESGRKDDRPKWGAALATVLSGGADGIAAVELSRFGRSTRHLLEVAHAVKQARRHLVCTRSPIDTTTPMGELVFTIFAAIAQFEAQCTADRIARTIRTVRADRRAKGKSDAWGRPREEPDAVALRLVETGLQNGLTWRALSAALAKQGFLQPARYRDGVEVRPARPWPIGTLRDACARVGIPTPKTVQ